MTMPIPELPPRTRALRVPVLLLALALVLPSATRAAEEGAPADPPDPGYRIGIEDVLRVAVWGEPSLNLSVQVRSDGRIALPLVQELVAAGRTPLEVREIVRERLTAYIREPKVTVMVEQTNSFRIFVLGEVGKQGPLNFVRPTRLLQGLAAAGGLTPYAKGRIAILREAGGVEERLKIDYKALLREDGAALNVALRPGDTLIVD